MAKRKSLETVLVEDFNLIPQAIATLKKTYGNNTQIEIVEIMLGYYSVEIWGF